MTDRPEDDGREGDAGERLDDLPEEPLADLAAEISADRAERLPTPTDEGRASGGAAENDRDAGPLGDLAAAVERRRASQSDDNLSDLFVSEEVGELNSDAVWEQIETGEVSIDEDFAAKPTEHVVEKAAFCQSCEFFSSPPDVACHHDGTEILELVDIERFRIQNCPKVERAQQLGEFDPADE